MGTMDYIALEVSGLTKQVVKDDNLRQLGKRDSDAHKPVVALDCGQFQVRYGEILGVLGGDRSGKSALVRSVGDLLVADDDRITVSGHQLLQDKVAVRRLINRVLADASRFNKLTPMEWLIYGARLYCLGKRKARERVLEVLGQVGLDEEDIFRPLEELSPCMQQRVAAACASLTQPVFLLLDEPTAGLTFHSKGEMQSFLGELRDVYNATILLTTRDVGEADALCDRVAILHQGQIVALDTPAGLRGLVPRTNGHVPTLAEVFVALTGKQLVQ